MTKINQGDDLRRAFGNAVKARRNRIGISQDELAWRATVHRTYITNVERGICNPSLGSISKIARALGTSTATLLADVEMSAGPESKSESSSVDILLVEDSENDVELTVQALKGAGLANIVDIARDGAEALDYFFSHDTHPGRKIKGRPGLILLDLNLPKVSGIEVLQRLKAEPSTASVPVVVLTASKHDGDVKECLRLGANAYIVKPVNFRSLSEVAPQLNLCWMLLRSPARAAA